jgi:hypothetical protein
MIVQRERERERDGEGEREREEVTGVLTNDATWRRSCRDGNTTTLNRGAWWCSDGEMVLGARRRDWSQSGWVDNGSALIAPFIGSWCGCRYPEDRVPPHTSSK